MLSFSVPSVCWIALYLLAEQHPYFQVQRALEHEDGNALEKDDDDEGNVQRFCSALAHKLLTAKQPCAPAFRSIQKYLEVFRSI